MKVFQPFKNSTMFDKTSPYTLLTGLIFIFLFLTGFVLNHTHDHSMGKMLQFQIQPASKLFVNGKTNINKFSCDSKERFTASSLSYELDKEEGTIYFENTLLKISIADLDCGMNAINRDLKKALLADEYPHIVIYLKKVVGENCKQELECNKWFEFQANTDITITCESRPMVIPLLVSKMSETSFRIKGQTTLKLCDFALAAPTAMMGLIKVNDEVEINFDLIVDVI